jgi:hypothetical protein
MIINKISYAIMLINTERRLIIREKVKKSLKLLAHVISANFANVLPDPGIDFLHRA